MIFHNEIERVLGLQAGTLEIDSLHKMRDRVDQRTFEMMTYLIAQKLVEISVTGMYEGGVVTIQFPSLPQHKEETNEKSED